MLRAAPCFLRRLRRSAVCGSAVCAPVPCMVRMAVRMGEELWPGGRSACMRVLINPRPCSCVPAGAGMRREREAAIDIVRGIELLQLRCIGPELLGPL